MSTPPGFDPTPVELFARTDEEVKQLTRELTEDEVANLPNGARKEWMPRHYYRPEEHQWDGTTCWDGRNKRWVCRLKMADGTKLQAVGETEYEAKWKVAAMQESWLRQNGKA